MNTNATSYGKRELWALLSQTSNALGKVADSELGQVGISMMQAAVLVFVKNSNRCTSYKIGRACSLI